ncbi:hypothetical protein BACCOP_00232 [Phocaeicola coprocola DSM 17136]|uniref:Uncharacterized protein n=1 Tax=Phocaeicola coprocola DSM 17136 TaxID=470145 RepID=B3JEE0_9BACT|nr:hypothetical protein BACCOP_00232 [Phocaeicola coprocola DSM 17136]
MTIDTPISGSCKASSTLPDTVLRRQRRNTARQQQQQQKNIRIENFHK